MHAEMEEDPAAEEMKMEDNTAFFSSPHQRPLPPAAARPHRPRRVCRATAG
jgi:hypothetical protein